MPDGFNMVTAMETIHRHIHAVGCGALPSCWMTGDPSFFCRADGLFVPSLAVWFGAACRRPFGDGSWDGYLPPMPRGSIQQGEEAEVLAGYAHGMERPELARAVCGTVRGAGLRKGASAQAVQDAWHR